MFLKYAHGSGTGWSLLPGSAWPLTARGALHPPARGGRLSLQLPSFLPGPHQHHPSRSIPSMRLFLAVTSKLSQPPPMTHCHISGVFWAAHHFSLPISRSDQAAVTKYHRLGSLVTEMYFSQCSRLGIQGQSAGRLCPVHRWLSFH